MPIVKDSDWLFGYTTIAGDIKLSPATVRKAIKDLRKVGLIETKQRYRTQDDNSSLLYKIHNN